MSEQEKLPIRYWREMDRPLRVGSCQKLRQGQLLMQRYKYVWDLGKNGKYADKAQVAKDKSMRLAKLMVEHVEGCDLCQSQRVLEEAFFYGVYK